MGSLNAPRRTGGFSLIEALVALTMLTAGVLLLGSTLSVTSTATRASLDTTVADHLVRQKLEELRATPYRDLRSGAETVGLARVEYVRRWTVRRNHPRPGVATIDVDVAWSDYVAPLTDVLSEPVVTILSNPVGSLTGSLQGQGETYSRSMSTRVSDR